MKRLLLSTLLALAILALALPTFACGHCNFNDQCVDDSNPDSGCYIIGTACLDRLCYAPGEAQPMLSEYAVQTVTVAHGRPDRQLQPAATLEARLERPAMAPAPAR